MLQALGLGDSSSGEVDTISTFASSDDMFLLDEVDEAIEAGFIEAKAYMAPYFVDTYQQGSLNGIRGDCNSARASETAARTSLQMGQMTSRTHDGIIHVKEAKKENVLSYLNFLSASAPDIHVLSQEKVALSPILPHSFPPTKLRMLTSQLTVPSTIKMSPLPTLSLSLPPISRPLDPIPLSLLPTPSRLSSLPILPSIPSKLPPLPSLPYNALRTLSQTSLLEPLPSTPSPRHKLPPLDLSIRATFKNTVAPLPPILSRAAQEDMEDFEAKEKMDVDGDVDGETDSISLKEVAEVGEKKKKKSLRKRFVNFIRRLNCFCCK